MASPSKLNARTVSTIAAPGNTVSHGASRSTIWPLLIMLPHVGWGSVMPRPRKLSSASVRIAVGTSSVHNTISGSIAFSNTWLTMIRGAEAPSARRFDVLALANRQDRSARDPREPRDHAHADRQHHGEQVVAEDGNRHHRQDQRRERQKDVGQTQDDFARPATEVACNNPQQRAQRGAET